ncbi:MAG: LON peptidase substrate-binding domain-containing protein, partial [Flavobacteriales bacterium]
MTKKNINFLNTDSDLGGGSAMISINDLPIDNTFDPAKLPSELPVLALRNTVLFPQTIMPITVSRDQSKSLIKDVEKSETKLLAVVAQKNPEHQDPKSKDMYGMGVLARVMKAFDLPNDTMVIVLQSIERIEISEFTKEKPYFVGVPKQVEPELVANEGDFDSITKSVKELALSILEESDLPEEASFTLENISESSKMLNYVCSNINAEMALKQSLLEESNLEQRAEKAVEVLTENYQEALLRNEIQARVRHGIDDQQREYFLNQQLKTIQDELGGQPAQQDIEEMKTKAKTKKWSKAIGETFEKELDRFSRINPQMSEYHVQRNYLET